MTSLANWFTPELQRIVALTLLHFFWQGALLAALAYSAFSLFRSASARYAAGVTLMVLMLVAPIATIFVLRQSTAAPETTASLTLTTPDRTLVLNAPAKQAATSAAAGFPLSDSPNYFAWLVEFWIAGVLLLSLRSAGGLFFVERLLRRESQPLSAEMKELCESLIRSMGLKRVVRFRESLFVGAPTVAGWLRPVVLLPVTALTGLDEAQLRAVIAHELAHIRRYDAFVNLFQVGVETLLFYHPAVWWLGRRIREERENCCDDVAVAVCGSPLSYARALAQLAESQHSPEFAMAANRGPLAARVARVLGLGNARAAIRGASLAIAVLCFSAAFLSASGFIGLARLVHAQSAPAAPAAAAAPSIVATPAPTAAPATPGSRTIAMTMPAPRAMQAPEAAAAPNAPAVAPAAPVAVPSAAAAPAVAPVAAAAPAGMMKMHFTAPVLISGMWKSFSFGAQSAGSSEPSSSYIDGLRAAGLQNLSVDDVIALKVQGVTPEYVKQMRDAGMPTDADELIGLKVQGITPEYIREMKAALGGAKLDADELIGLKVQGITPAYVKEIHDLGFKSDADELIGMKVQGVTPEYVKQMRALGLKMDADELIGMKVQGVTPEYVKGIQDAGFHPDADELIGMKVQGVDAEYLKALQNAGFKVDVDDAIGAKVQGITPAYLEKVQKLGLKNLSLHQLIALKISGALDSQ